MANDTERYPSRLNKKNRSNSILNMMIGLVFVLILIVAAFIFMDRNENPVQQAESVTVSNGAEGQTAGGDGGNSGGTEAAAAEENDEQTDEENAEDADSEENAAEDAEEEGEEGTVTIEGSVTYEESSDPIVKETVINTGWQPVGTKQSGEHVSVYDPNSVDWKEKIQAIEYATGLEESNMHIMMIQNGGGPQKAIGTVTSKDMAEKYRVHLEWVDEKGWKPVKMDILNTIEGAY